MIHYRMAWRNIWRNKRRTAITLASIFFAVVLSSFMMSIKEGMYAHMIDASVGSYSGHAQISTEAFRDNHTIDDGFEYDVSFLKRINGNDAIAGMIPRIENFALAASRERSKGSMVIGTDVDAEHVITGLDERVVAGRYIKEGDKMVLIGEGLADYLDLDVNDTLVLLGQGYHGVSAAGKYPVSGIVKFGSPDLSKQLVIMPLGVAQEFYGCPGVITNLNLWSRYNGFSIKDKNAIQELLDGGMIVRSWQEIMPEIDKMISADRVEGYVFMFILYLVISFGIFGTILMMLVERNYEFGMLLSIGMKRKLLGTMVWTEALALSLAGALAGVIGAVPVCYYFNRNPIRFGGDFREMFEEYGFEPVMRASLDPSVFIQQAVIVGLLATLLSLYPLFRVRTIDPLTSMRR
jgi:ABC-type lipoprotein release transport system permease subunit